MLIIVSDGVPDDVVVTPLCIKLPLLEGAGKWATELIHVYERYPVHPDYSNALLESGYDIRNESIKMMNYYFPLK